MNAVRLLLGFLPLGGPPVVPQFLPEVAAVGEGDKAGGGLSSRVQGLLPGSIVSSESEWTAESSSESPGIRNLVRNNPPRALGVRRHVHSGPTPE